MFRTGGKDEHSAVEALPPACPWGREKLGGDSESDHHDESHWAAWGDHSGMNEANFSDAPAVRITALRASPRAACPPQAALGVGSVNKQNTVSPARRSLLAASL